MELLRRALKEFDLRLLKCSKLVEVEGISLLDSTAANLELLRNFKAQPDDLLICTYPKAGTTWMQEIVDMIQHGGDKQKCARAPIYERIPFIDLFPIKPISSVAWGSWFEHVRGWWEAKNSHPILYVFYEDIKEGTGKRFYTVEGELRRANQLAHGSTTDMSNTRLGGQMQPAKWFHVAHEAILETMREWPLLRRPHPLGAC